MLGKSYFYEIRKIKEITRELYEEMPDEEELTIYFYKPNNSSIIVRAPKIKIKIHGYAIFTLQILQKKNDNDRIFHWKQMEIRFHGQLILTLVKEFNQNIYRQVTDAVTNISPSLSKWLEEPIDDIFLIHEKRAAKFLFQHSFLYIQTILRVRYKQYFETTAWIDEKWEQLLKISKGEKIEVNDSYGKLLDRINEFINKYSVLKNQKYTNMYSNRSKEVKKPKSCEVTPEEQAVCKKYGLFQLLK